MRVHTTDSLKPAARRSDLRQYRNDYPFAIADNYILMDELFQAKATLNSVIEKSPDENIIENAKKKLQEIEDMAEKEVMPADSLPE